MGKQLADAGNLSESVECFARLISTYSGDAAALNEIALSLCSVNLQEYAIPLFDTVLRLRPEEAAVIWCNKGNALLELDRAGDALGCYANSIEIDAVYIHSHIQAANANYRLGRWDDAADCYSRALSIDALDEESGLDAARLSYD